MLSKKQTFRKAENKHKRICTNKLAFFFLSYLIPLVREPRVWFTIKRMKSRLHHYQVLIGFRSKLKYFDNSTQILWFFGFLKFCLEDVIQNWWWWLDSSWVDSRETTESFGHIKNSKTKCKICLIFCIPIYSCSFLSVAFTLLFFLARVGADGAKRHKLFWWFCNKKLILMLSRSIEQKKKIIFHE